MSSSPAVRVENSLVAGALQINDLVDQVNLIQDVITKVMREDVHYGVIPGTNGKTLLQPGAQKLANVFRLANRVLREERREYPEHPGHREYEITIEVVHIASGAVLAHGVGTASTLERRYRYRSEIVGPVPQAYWDDRDQALLGGSGFKAKKIKGKWFVTHQVEHDDPADYYNTARKMAAKRAFVHGILNATAASDCFADGEDSGRRRTADPEQAPEDDAPPVELTEEQRRVSRIREELRLSWEGVVEILEAAGHKVPEKVGDVAQDTWRAWVGALERHVIQTRDHARREADTLPGPSRRKDELYQDLVWLGARQNVDELTVEEVEALRETALEGR